MPSPPLPREHGAWGLLLQPFFAAVIVSGTWTWFYLPALALALNGFLLKEPLVTWLRHRFVWKKPAPDSSARNWMLGTLAAIALCASVLPGVFPPVAMAVLLGAGLAMTVVSVVFTLQNRQRSMAFQMINAAGLTGTSLLAAFTATQTLPRWSWVLWAFLAAHAVAAIPLVHTRLELKARKPTARGLYRFAIALQAGALAAAAWWRLGPVAFSAVANLVELLRLRNPEALNEPLKKVGLRLLFTSIAHTVLAIAVVKWWMARTP